MRSARVMGISVYGSDAVQRIPYLTIAAFLTRNALGPRQFRSLQVTPMCGTPMKTRPGACGPRTYEWGHNRSGIGWLYSGRPHARPRARRSAKYWTASLRLLELSQRWPDSDACSDGPGMLASQRTYRETLRC
jgi:hypothetical protein